MVILPFWGVLGPILVTLVPNLGVTYNWTRWGKKNGGIATKMSTLALLVSDIWSFYPFWVVLGPILVPLGPNFGVTDNWGCLKLL